MLAQRVWDMTGSLIAGTYRRHISYAKFDGNGFSGVCEYCFVDRYGNMVVSDQLVSVKIEGASACCMSGYVSRLGRFAVDLAAKGQPITFIAQTHPATGFLLPSELDEIVTELIGMPCSLVRWSGEGPRFSPVRAGHHMIAVSAEPQSLAACDYMLTATVTGADNSNLPSRIVTDSAILTRIPPRNLYRMESASGHLVQNQAFRTQE